MTRAPEPESEPVKVRMSLHHTVAWESDISRFLNSYRIYNLNTGSQGSTYDLVQY